MDGPREFQFKVIVVGEIGVGKTSIIRRFLDDIFLDGYKATIGVDFAHKLIQVDSMTRVRLQLWDIAGQERFGNMTRVYYRDSHAAIVVFDLTNERSFEAVQNWKRDIDDKIRLPDGSHLPCILLGNKCDVKDKKLMVSDEEAHKFARENNFITYYPCSAKSAKNVKTGILELVKVILQLMPDPEKKEEAPDLVDLYAADSQPKPKNKSTCC